MPHLMWTCPQTADLRHRNGITMPLDTMVERLLLRWTIPRAPRACKHILCNHAFAQQVHDLLAEAWDISAFQQSPLMIATDAGSNAGLAVVGVATWQGTTADEATTCSYSSSDAELWALVIARQQLHCLAILKANDASGQFEGPFQLHIAKGFSAHLQVSTMAPRTTGVTQP